MRKQVEELINEYFVAKETLEAARALLVEYLTENSITSAEAERGSVKWSNGYENRPAFDAKAFEKANPEIAAKYQKMTSRAGSYVFRAS